jgi:hypothetical protein
MFLRGHAQEKRKEQKKEQWEERIDERTRSFDLVRAPGGTGETLESSEAIEAFETS